MIRAPKDLKTRPTQARLRQALFNSLQASIPEARVLDLFAGSGSLGFEALSRGASSVVFVENGRQAVRLIEQNAADLGVTARIQVLDLDVGSAARMLLRHGPFDVVLADPPYADGWETRLLTELPWAELLAPGGVFCLEWGTVKSQVAELPEQAACLAKVREKNYGDSVLTTYERTDS